MCIEVVLTNSMWLESKMFLIYCKTRYFCCILILRFWDVEIMLHFNFAFSQCHWYLSGLCWANWIFSRVFDVTILSHLWNSWKFHACENNVVYSILKFFVHFHVDNIHTYNTLCGDEQDMSCCFVNNYGAFFQMIEIDKRAGNRL